MREPGIDYNISCLHGNIRVMAATSALLSGLECWLRSSLVMPGLVPRLSGLNLVASLSPSP
jgi:hypothetical protein